MTHGRTILVRHSDNDEGVAAEDPKWTDNEMPTKPISKAEDYCCVISNLCVT